MFSLRVVGAAIVIASMLLMSTLAALLATRPSRPVAAQGTAVLTLIAAHTATPLPGTANPGTAAAGEATVVPTLQPGVIAVGAYVSVVGTGGDGLRLRDVPGLEGTVLMLGSEAEVFKVQEGPREVDGYTWWYLVGPFDENRRGWAVANYLQISEGQ